MSDRDTIKRGGNLARVPDDEPRLIFRNLFIDDRDAEIAKIVWNYFDAVRERWPTAWQEVGRGNVLNRTTGLVALSRFLGDAYRDLYRPGSIVSKEQFRQLFDSIELEDNDFNPDRFKPGGTGQNDLYRELERHAQRDLFNP